MDNRQVIVGRGCWRHDDPTVNGKISRVTDLPDGDAVVTFVSKDGVTRMARLSSISLSPTPVRGGRVFKSIEDWKPL